MPATVSRLKIALLSAGVLALVSACTAPVATQAGDPIGSPLMQPGVGPRPTFGAVGTPGVIGAPGTIGYGGFGGGLGTGVGIQPGVGIVP